jgi:hypothetical protein
MPVAARSHTRGLTRRTLLELVAPTTRPGARLRVDTDAGIIFGVRVLGRFSRNSHGAPGAVNGTEYTRACMESALPMYEDAPVKVGHPADRNRPGVERSPTETFGTLRNARVETDEQGEPCVRADLHFYTTHPLAERVVEDVQRGLGKFGLSHNAAAARERVDRGSRRLVIESLALVRSVDLVDNPATNRNLWEADSMDPIADLDALRSVYSPSRSGPPGRRPGGAGRPRVWVSAARVSAARRRRQLGESCDPATDLAALRTSPGGPAAVYG